MVVLYHTINPMETWGFDDKLDGLHDLFTAINKEYIFPRYYMDSTVISRFKPSITYTNVYLSLKG